MSRPAPLTLYTFLLQKSADVLVALKKMQQAKDRLVATGIKVIPNMYEYVDAIVARIEQAKQDEQLADFDKNIVRLIDLSLIREFMAKPSDKVTRDAVSLQLIMIHSALGLLKDVEPYDPIELFSFFEKERGYYSDEILAHTLRDVYAGNQTQHMVPILLVFLTEQAKEGAEHMFDWHGAVIQTQTLQAVWKHFALLQSKDQTFLIREFFYMAIACGVPVMKHIGNAFEGVAKKDLDDVRSPCLAGLNQNMEEAVLAFPRSTRLFSELLKTYRTQYREKIRDPISQETYVRQLYDRVPQGLELGRWLRDALTSAIHIQESDFV